ncbi:trinucleotide repeat-containing gene 6C protein-like isoform X2 [Physella acuta]|uniref:trinucleotide repeat-containing gene 6C protein-like isoform X2 n=1 Tax=Physella acuta TaxID=109671 RepID=UPI0027DE09FC|nr:trinucleotide repeat-containing gene 6C protein-like isoform X2 [Physella acuta]
MQQQDQDNSSSTWQAMGKSDSASDAGDDSSSVKSGSTITSLSNITSQSQESTNTNAGTIQSSSSSLWSASNSTLSGMDSNPWGNSSSPAPSNISSMGWTNPSSLSLSTSQGHNNSNLQGPAMIGGSSAFNAAGSSSNSGWPSSITSNGLSTTSNIPPNITGGNMSSHWPGSSMLGGIGDFSKNSEWNNPSTPVEGGNKDLGSTNSDPRMWGLSSEKSGDAQWEISKTQWGNSPLTAQGDQVPNSELSFAQATLKGLKVPPVPNTPQTAVNSRQEEILRAIENHEGWGSRPIRQDTSWDVETSPKSNRKFSADSNTGASNVWNNSNGTAIWESVRENQNSNYGGGGGTSGNTWSGEKDQTSWAGPPKSAQDPSTWNVGNGTDPKAFGTWGAASGAGDASNKMWGQKTEVGSWGEGGGVQRTTSISSWGDDGDAGGWEDQRRITGNISSMQGLVPPSPSMNTPSVIPNMVPQNMAGLNVAGIGSEVTPWNESQKAGWNPTNVAAINRTKLEEPWNKPPPNRTGWGDPTQDGGKVDDGTSIWAANAPKQLPPQAKPSGWGETAPPGQWNAAIGTKPKAPAGWDEASWAMAQRAKSGRYPDEDPSSSVEVGYWNGLPQDNNTWNDPAALRSVRKITGQQMPPKYMGGNSNPPTQMRAKLLQELMDMGFRKEEAQNALITNNLNLKMALNDLKSSNGGMARKDLDMDVFQTNGSQSRIPYMQPGGIGTDDLTDMRPDQVPTFNNLQNTQFPNSPNQPFMQNTASLPPSSLNPNSSSINHSLQQKLAQKMQQNSLATTIGPRGQLPPVGSGGNNQVPQQQQQQQQILAQLRQAVNNGFISPQLLNYQLPHNILVLLQQLLQLQSALQNMVTKQQQMVQQARATGARSNPQLDQMPTIINNINQQIINVQKQLQQAQNNLFSTTKPPNMSQPPSGLMAQQSGQQPMVNIAENLDALSSDLANVVLQSQSRLTTQWKAPSDSNTPTIEGAIASASSNTSDENGEKSSGGKTLLQSSSSPNLNLIPGGLGMTGDKTWSSNMSTTTSSNWPLSSSDNSTNSQSDLKVSSSILTGMPSGLTDVIPEFIPGKPWQGLTKNVEDDPHVTPGSIQRSLSVNRVHDDSLNNLDGHKLNSSSSWSFKNENSLGLGQLGNRPPPIAPNKTGQQWQSGPFNRQASWPHSSNSAFTKVGGSNWNESRGAISSWIVLKNLNPSMDSATIRSLCSCGGNVTSFYYMGQVALVQYSSRDSAYSAQQKLHNFQMGTSVITAEFMGEAEAQRIAAQMQPPQQSAIQAINQSPWSQAPPSGHFTGGRDPWGSSMPSSQPKYSSGGMDPWNLWDVSDHNSNPLLNNILGGESM